MKSSKLFPLNVVSNALYPSCSVTEFETDDKLIDKPPLRAPDNIISL